ncbi:MAG: NAD-dependent epimerase/dehydratase family protein [Deltaproteobacteria bacterium]|nr:NAD-dependent epimerase/dehydratase family protein [Deltaproteobacteria bacterium]
MAAPPTVLVTGASGFIGGRLAVALRQRGYRVRAHFRPGDDAGALERAGVECFASDICDRDSLERAARGCEGVFHVAGNVSFRRRDRALQRRVNVEGTRAVLAACRRAGVRRLVHTSTVNTLGPARPAGALADEDTLFDPRGCGLHYAETKKQAEDLALAAGRDGLEVVVVHPGTVFGPGDRFANAGSYILAIARLPVLLSPAGGTNCVHVDTVVEGHIAAFERGRAGQRYILGGQNLRYREIFATIAAALGKPAPIATLPTWLAAPAAAVLERLFDRLGIEANLSAEAARAGGMLLYYSSARAERELGLRPLPFSRAVREAVDWYRREGRI